jgi:hypothetical protein
LEVLSRDWVVVLDQLNVVRRAPQLLVDFGQVGKRDRADVITKGVAELQDDHLAEMVAQAQLLAVGAVRRGKDIKRKTKRQGEQWSLRIGTRLDYTDCGGKI